MKTHLEGLQSCTLRSSSKTSRREVLAGLVAGGAFFTTQVDAQPCTDESDLARLNSLKALYRNTGISMDFWADLTEGLNQDMLSALEVQARLVASRR
jgi:hypothetical protein